MSSTNSAVAADRAEPGVLPCHVITGPLGVGKTTTILQLLKARQGRERIGVLLNDFGPVGLDEAVVAGETGEGDTDGEPGQGRPGVVNVPGGCVCCSAAGSLDSGLAQLLAVAGLDRVIVEPSGLAVPNQIVDVLRMLSGKHGLSLRPIIVVVDPRKFDPETAALIPYHRQILEAADVLVLNRCDLASEAQIRKLEDWAETVYPPKLRVLRTEYGHVPGELLDIEAAARALAERDASESEHASGRHHEHSHAHAHQAHHPHHHDRSDAADGFVLGPETRFDAERLRAALQSIAERPEAPRRLKGIFRTNQGWIRVEFTADGLDQHDTGYRRDNRADWVLPVSADDPAPVHAEICEALLATRYESA